MPKTMPKDVLTGALLAALGAVTLALSEQLPDAASAAQDPGLLPSLVATALLICGLGTVAVGLLKRRRAAGTGGAAAAADDADGIPMALPVDLSPELEREIAAQHAEVPAWGITGALFAAVAVYGIAAFQVGYVTTTLAFLVVVPLLLGWRREPRRLIGLAVFAVVLTAVMCGLLFELLNVPLPRTPLA